MFRVLAVDDDPEVLEMYKRLLGSLGAEVDMVQSPSEVLKLLYNTCHRHYNLLITDLIMPGLSGDNLARVVRCNRRIPVIMVTAAELGEDETTASHWYIRKPLEGKHLSEFLELVKRLMEKALNDKSTCACDVDVCAGKVPGMPLSAYCNNL